MRTITLAAVIGAVTALAQPASATTRYAIFRGTIDSRVDNAGVFGTPGSLVGRS